MSDTRFNSTCGVYQLVIAFKIGLNTYRTEDVLILIRWDKLCSEPVNSLFGHKPDTAPLCAGKKLLEGRLFHNYPLRGFHTFL